MTLQTLLEAEVGGVRAPGAVVAISEAGGPVEIACVNADPDALIGAGSVTKVMTATLVLQLVEQGKLSLDDPIARHVPDFRLDSPEHTERVTIRHLLTHTSGIDCADDFSDTGDDDDCLARFVSEAVSGSRLLHEPGAEWSYSNAGFSVLGRLIERTHGTPWDDVLASRVLDPIGLTATTAPRLRRHHNVAMGHRWDHRSESFVDEPRFMVRSGGPAGSNLLSTARDLVVFADALLDGSGRLLGPELADAMRVPHIEFEGQWQGLGWSMPRAGHVAHPGSTIGSSAHLEALPGVRAIAVVADGPGASLMAAAIQEQRYGLRPPPRPVDSGANLPADKCVGIYERRNVVHRLQLREGQLTATTSYSGQTAQYMNATSVVLRPAGGRRYTSQEPHGVSPGQWVFADLDDLGRPRTLLANHRMATRKV